MNEMINGKFIDALTREIIRRGINPGNNYNNYITKYCIMIFDNLLDFMMII